MPTITGFIAVGDLHLKPQTWANRPEIRGDAYESFAQIIGMCITQHCPLVLMGDILNSNHPDSRSIDVLTAGFKAMGAAELEVYVIQGQHDRSEPPWPLAVNLPHVHYVNKKVFSPIPGGPVLYALDNVSGPDEVIAALTEIPGGVTGLVIHQTARQVMPIDGAWDFDVGWLPANIKCVLAGDYHLPETFKWKTGTGYYSGSTYMCAVNEVPAKSVLRVSTDLQVTRIPLITRTYTYLALNDEQGVEACLANAKQMAELKPEDQLPVFVINYLTTLYGTERKLIEAFKGKAYLWLRPVALRTEWDSATDTTDNTVVKASLESCVTMYFPEGTEENNFLLDLLTRPETEAVLNEWRTRKQVA